MGIIRLTKTIDPARRKIKMNNVLKAVMTVIRAATFQSFVEAVEKVLEVCDDNPGKQVSQPKLIQLSKKSIVKLDQLRRTSTAASRKKGLDALRVEWNAAADVIVTLINNLQKDETIHFSHANLITELGDKSHDIFTHDIIFIAAEPIRVNNIPKEIQVFKVATGRTVNGIAFGKQTILALPTDDAKAAQDIIDDINRERGTDYVNICNNSSRESQFFSHNGSKLFYAWLVDSSISSKIRLIPKIVRFTDDEPDAKKPNDDFLRKQREVFETLLSTNPTMQALKEERKMAVRMKHVKRKGKPLYRSVAELDREIEAQRSHLLEMFSGRSAKE